MVSPSILLIIGIAGFAVAAVASIGLQFGGHSRAFTYSLALGMLVGIISVGARIMLDQAAPSEVEESFIMSLFTKR